MTITATSMDTRRRLHLPKELATAAGLTAGPVVVAAGSVPGELVVCTPAAALARLRRALTRALTLTGDADSLSTVLAARPGRGPSGPGGATAAVLPEAGPVMADTAVITALLDGAPHAGVLEPLLPRLVLADPVVDDLLHTVLEAGLPAESEDPASFTGIMATLLALGVTESGRDAVWAPVRVLEYELTKAGVDTLAERVTLAVAAARGLPALLARTVVPVDTVPVTGIDYRDLSNAGGGPGESTPGDEPGALDGIA